MKAAIFFPDGVGIRNFMLGSFLHRAATKGEVYAFHLIPERLLGTYQKGSNGNVNWHRCIPYRDAPLPLFLRKALGHAHLCYCDTQSMRYARKLPLRGSTARRAMTSAARAFGRMSASPTGIKKLLRWHERAAMHLPEVDQYKRVFEEIRPTVLFCTHQRPLDVIPAALAAKEMGIPTSTFIFSWDNLTSKARFAAPFDHFLVWSDQMRNELLQYYPEVPPDNIHVVGTPQFDPYADDSLLWSRDEFCRRLGADPSRPILCYSGGVPETTPEDPLHVKILLELIQKGHVRGQPQVLLRPAPVDLSSRYDDVRRAFPELIYSMPQWQQTQADSWSTVMPAQEDVEMLANLTHHADLNVNVASTMTLDFAIHDKPVVNIAFDVSDPPPFGVPLGDYYYNFEHYRPVVELGAARVARSPDELADHVNAYLQGPTLDAEARRRFVELEVDLPIGRSSARIVEVLESISNCAL